MTKIVNDDSFTIGRSMDCAISLTEDSISRVHLCVYRRQDQIWIEDKGSSNGTFVNNVKIAANTLVNVIATDRIRVGKSDYLVSIKLELTESEENAKNDSTDFMQEPLAAEKIVERKMTLPSMDKTVDKRTVEAEFSVDKLNKKIAEQRNEQRAEQEKKSTDFPAPKFEPKASAQSILKTNPTPNPAPSEYNNNSAQFEGERILHEAHKKAAQIIYDGEIQAEKRVQAIYVQARERQGEADNYYQKKIATAHKEADAIIHAFQTQGQELITQARHMAQELRDEVDLYVENMREKTRKEVEHIIDDARQEADSVKKEAFEKAISKAEIEASDIISNAKAEAQDLVGFAKMQSDEMLEKARAEIEADLKDLMEQQEAKRKRLQSLKKEEEEFDIRIQGEREEHEAKIADLSEKFKTLQEEINIAQKDLTTMRTQETQSREQKADLEKKGEELRKQNQQLLQDRTNLEVRIKDLQGQLGHITFDIQGIEEKRKMMENDLSQQKAQLKDRIEREQQQILKESEERMHEAQLEMGKRLQKLERELFDEIVSRKDALVKEIIVIVETRIAKVLETSKWDQVSGLIFEGVQAAIEGKAVSFTDPKTGAPKQSMSLQRKKKKEHYRWLTGGVIAGLALAFGGLRTYTIMTQDKNPMRTIAQEESRRRQEDLEKRRFNPAQAPEVKDTYTDSVIYTSGFVAAYQDSGFQEKLYKATSAYLLKTWRVDEDKSIQVLSMSSALVKELAEKKQNIHPDYVKDGILKMRQLEKESTDRMKAVLGGEVRLESYRRFERKFFEQEILKRGVAGGN